MPEIDLLALEKQVREEEAEALEKFVKGTGEAPVLYRAVSGAVSKADGDGPVEFVLSHESDDRMGDIIRQDGWDLTNFKKNPVMLWAHDSRGIPPIGKWSNVRIDSRTLLGSANFDTDDPFAASIESKVRRGFLNAVSVGFRPLEMEWRPEKEGENGGGSLFRPAADFKKQELLETSIVSVPAHPKALRKALELAIDGAPQAKRFIFLPGQNFGTFEAKAIEEPPAQNNKDAHADETDTVVVNVTAALLDGDVERIAAAIVSHIKASPVAVEPAPVSAPDPAPALTPPAVSDNNQSIDAEKIATAARSLVAAFPGVKK